MDNFPSPQKLQQVNVIEVCENRWKIVHNLFSELENERGKGKLPAVCEYVKLEPSRVSTRVCVILMKQTIKKGKN